VVWSEVKAWTELLKEEEEDEVGGRAVGAGEGRASQQARWRCPSLAQQHSLGWGRQGLALDERTGRTRLLSPPARPSYGWLINDG
jgi:hypothetical protein